MSKTRLTTVTRTQNNNRALTEGRVTLPDYEIPRPRMLMLKLNETQKIHVDLWAAPAASDGAAGIESAGTESANSE